MIQPARFSHILWGPSTTTSMELDHIPSSRRDKMWRPVCDRSLDCVWRLKNDSLTTAKLLYHTKEKKRGGGESCFWKWGSVAVERIQDIKESFSRAAEVWKGSCWVKEKSAWRGEGGTLPGRGKKKLGRLNRFSQDVKLPAQHCFTFTKSKSKWRFSAFLGVFETLGACMLLVIAWVYGSEIVKRIRYRFLC